MVDLGRRFAKEQELASGNSPTIAIPDSPEIGGWKARVTEAEGELALTAFMLIHHSEFQLAHGFQKGTGFDQVWVKVAGGGKYVAGI